MEDERISRAMARIDAAAKRIEAAASRMSVPDADPDLAARHERLKQEASSALAQIDMLIEALDG